MTQRIYTLQLILLSAGYADKPTQTYLYLTGRSDINGIQTEHSTPDAGGKSGVAGDVAQDIRVRRGDDQSGRERSSGLVSGETSQGAAVQLSSYDWYNNDVDFGQPPVLVESSEQGITKGGAENAGTQSGVSPEARLSVGDAAARKGADGNGDTGARLDGLSGRHRDGGVVPTGRLDGRGNSSVPEIVRLSETDKKLISDSGATAVELDDYTEQPAVFSSALETARETDTINGWAVSPQKALDGEYTEYSQDYLDSLPESMMSTHSQIAKKSSCLSGCRKIPLYGVIPPPNKPKRGLIV